MKKILSPKYLILGVLTVIGLLIATSYVQLQRDVPGIDVEALVPEQAGDNGEAQGGADESSLQLPWPSKGSAAIAVAGAGIVDSRNDRQNRPIASLAKVMTAYVILKDHPLRPGDAGPVIEIQQADVQTYLAQQANGESVIAVRAGQTFTLEQMLQGLLIPSGNNFAFILATWNSGSVEAFAQRMNEEAAALGMTNTRYEEPSGISAGTRSTAADQTRLAEVAMANPIIAAIVNMKQTQLPNVGILYNVNSELGKDNQAGIKTGWTEEAGGCFMFAADWMVDGAPVQLYGAVLGQDTLADAFGGTKALVATMGPSLQRLPVATKDVEVAAIETKWGGRTGAVAATNASIIVWPGLKVESSLEAGPDAESVKKGETVGTMVYRAGAQAVPVSLLAGESISGASLRWRLTRLF